MKKTLWALTVIGLLLVLAGPAAAQSGSVGIYSVAACKDTTTVAVSGKSDYATNRVKVSVYVQDAKGNYNLRAEIVSSTFGSGSFLLPITVDYSHKSVAEGTSLRIDVKLQRQSGSGFSTVSGPVSTFVAAADKYCQDKCTVTITASDRAPTKGTLTLRTHFGAWFRPEGRLYGAIPVNAGQILHATVVGVPCDAAVRVWYYPATGKDRTPKLLPAQYWPNEFAATTADGAIPYTTSFSKGLLATKPLESDDPYAPK